MKQLLLLISILQIMTSCKGQENNTTFSQTISENEKQLSAILDTLDNPYYWQTTPLDRMGYVPPGAYDNFDKKYPFRTQLRQLLDSIKTVLEKPMSESYLLTLLAPKYTNKLDANYRRIADKLIEFHSDSTNLKLWDIAIAKYETDRKYVYDDLRAYVIEKFVDKQILKDQTRAYIILNKDFKTHYFGYFDKEIDLKVIDAQILYLQTEMKKQSLGDASRWAGYLFIENGLLPRYDAPVNFRNWYQAKYYNKNAKKDEKSYPDWDNDDDKKNVELTIRFLKAIKENYDEINEEYKIKKE